MSWKSVRLADVSQVFNGKTPSKDEQRDAGHPVLKIKNVNENGAFKGVFESFVDIELAEKFSDKHLKVDDSLILNAAHNSDYVGSKQYRAESEVVGSLPTGEWLIARANAEKLNPRFLNYWLRSPQARFQIKQLVKGIHLYPKDVARLEIPLPPLPEQKRIAAILDKADAIRRKRQQAIQLADDFLRAVFFDMFGDPVTNPKGWEVKEIASVCSDIVDCPHSTPAYSASVTAFPCLRSSELQDGKLDFSEVKYVDINVYEDRIKRLKPEGGDIVYCREGARLGNLAIIPDGMSPCLGQRTMLFRVDRSIILPEVFLSILNNAGVQREVQDLSIGAAAPRVNIKDLIGKNIYCPLLDKQKAFVVIHNKVSKTIRSLGLFDISVNYLVDSLSQKAFRGDL